MKGWLITFALSVATLAGLCQQPGTVDESFVPSEIRAPVRAMALQADGRIIVGSDLPIGATGSSLARLQAVSSRIYSAGALDTNFRPPPMSNVLAVAVQKDGKILAWGDLQSPTGRVSSLHRFFSDGKLDHNFKLENPYQSGIIIGAVYPLSDGVFVHGGVPGVASFFSIQNEDGSIRVFGGNSHVNFTAEYPGDKVLLGANTQGMLGGDVGATFWRPLGSDFIVVNRSGAFERFINVECGPCAGVLADRVFHATSVVTQPDGKIIFNGRFAVHPGQYPFPHLTFSGTIRLGANGMFDPLFQLHPELGSAIVIAQPNGKIIQAGMGGHDGSGGLLRLTAVGEIDRSFHRTPQARSEGIRIMKLQADGKILIGGFFTDFQGTGRAYLARLHGDDPTPRPPSITVQPASQEVFEKTNAWLSVQADGPGLFFQWSKNQIPIAGATNEALLLANVGAGDTAIYSVAVSNALGVAVSEAAVLRVVLNPYGIVSETPESAADLAPGISVLEARGWFAQTNSSVRGGSALRGGRDDLPSYGEALRLSVTGPGILSFWTMTPPAPYLMVLQDTHNRPIPPESLYLELSNETEWTEHRTHVPPGIHTYDFNTFRDLRPPMSPVFLDNISFQPEIRFVRITKRAPDDLSLFYVAAAATNVAVETSTDLASWTTQTNITSMTSVAGATNTVTLHIPDPPNAPARFFRLRLVSP